VSRTREKERKKVKMIKSERRKRFRVMKVRKQNILKNYLSKNMHYSVSVSTSTPSLRQHSQSDKLHNSKYFLCHTNTFHPNTFEKAQIYLS
jgi:hypothetical protein